MAIGLHASSLQRPIYPFWAQSTATGDIPAQGIAQITDITGDGIYLVQVPAFSGISAFVILRQSLPVGGRRLCYPHGSQLVTVTLQPGETIAVRDRIRPHAGSCYARAFELGPMLVEEVIGASSNSGGSDITTTVRARITGWRADHQYVMNSAESIHGSAAVLVFRRGYELGAGATGVPYIQPRS